jgi:hypothetical protein
MTCNYVLVATIFDFFCNWLSMFILYMVKCDYDATIMQLLKYSSFHLDNFSDCFHPKIGSYVLLITFGIKISYTRMNSAHFKGNVFYLFIFLSLCLYCWCWEMLVVFVICYGSLSKKSYIIDVIKMYKVMILHWPTIDDVLSPHPFF